MVPIKSHAFSHLSNFLSSTAKLLELFECELTFIYLYCYMIGGSERYRVVAVEVICKHVSSMIGTVEFIDTTNVSHDQSQVVVEHSIFTESQ